MRRPEEPGPPGKRKALFWGEDEQRSERALAFMPGRVIRSLRGRREA
jgi:hypothetical protein